MPQYTVFLNRAYRVDIEAEDREHAARLAELYLSHCEDISTHKDRELRKFRITEIEPADNDAIGVVEN